MPKKPISELSFEQNALNHIRQVALQNVKVSGNLTIGSIRQIINYTQPNRLSVIVDETHPPSDGWQERPEQEQILMLLQSNQSRLIGIFGAGGFGKSALADRIYRQAENFQTIWINFRDPYPFIRFARWLLEKKFNYQIDEELDANDLATEVLNCLTSKRFLLVLDNLETLVAEEKQWSTYRQFLGRWLEAGGESSILITSREQITLPKENVPGGCYWFTLQGLPINQGIALLRSAGIQGTEANLKKFVALASGHPLLLKLVISWLHNPDRQGDSPNIVVLTETQIDLFSQLVGSHRGNEEASVGALFAESFRRLSSRLQKLLVSVTTYRLAFNLNAAQIILPTENVNENDLRSLIRQSFLLRQRQGGEWKFEFHPLIKRYLQTIQLSADNQESLHWRAVLHYESVAKPREWETQEDIAEYLEIFYHLCELKQYAQAFDFLQNSDCDRFLQERGYNSIRADLYAPLVQQWQPTHDSEDKRSYAWMLNCLGFAYQALSEYEKARESHQRAQQIFHVLGTQDSEARTGEAEALRGLGDALKSLSQNEGAIEFYKRAEEIKRQLGDVIGATDILLNLADFYIALKRYDESLKQYEQLFEYSRRDCDLRMMAHYRNEIGRIYQKIGQYSEAITNHKKALQISQEVSNPGNLNKGLRTEAAKAFYELGRIDYRLAQHQKSAENHRQALEIFQEVEDNDREANTLLGLGIAYGELGRYSEAIENCQKAKNIFQKLGSRDREGNCWNCLGIIYHTQKNYLAAKEHYLKALEITDEIGGEKYTYLMNLGNLFYDQDQFQAAVRYYRRSLDANPSAEPNKEASTRSDLARAYKYLAHEYSNRAEYLVAIDLLQRALEFFNRVEARCRTDEEQKCDKDGKYHAQRDLDEARQKLDKSYQATADFLNRVRVHKRESGDPLGEAEALLGLGNVHHPMGKYEEAREYYGQALEIFQAISSPKGSEGSANVWVGLSKIHGSLKEYSEAIKLLTEQVLPTFEELDDSFGKANSWNTLGYVNYALGKYKESIQWHTEALTISQSIEARLGEADSQNGLGAAYSSLGQYENAVGFLNQALTTRKELSDRAGEGDTYCNFGNLYFFQVNYEQAIQSYATALDILQAIGHSEFATKASSGLERIYSAQNKNQKAAERYQQLQQPFSNTGIRVQVHQGKTPLPKFPVVQEVSQPSRLKQPLFFLLFILSGTFLSTYLLGVMMPRLLNDSAFSPPITSEALLSTSSNKSSPSPLSSPSLTTSGRRVICPRDRTNFKGLNIRQSPGLSAPIISVIPCNAAGIQIIGRGAMANGEFWVSVQYQASQGWVVKRFLSDQ